jgi:hypothetical protein
MDYAGMHHLKVQAGGLSARVVHQFIMTELARRE